MAENHTRQNSIPHRTHRIIITTPITTRLQSAHQILIRHILSNQTKTLKIPQPINFIPPKQLLLCYNSHKVLSFE